MKALLEFDGFKKTIEIDEPKLFYKYSIILNKREETLLFINRGVHKIDKQDMAYYEAVVDAQQLQEELGF